jgi:hypothetical protein
VKKLLVVISLAGASTAGIAGPLQWNPVPAPSFSTPQNSYSAPPVSNYQAPSYSYHSPSYVRTPNGTATVKQIDNKTYMVRDSNGNIHYCRVVSSGQTLCP